MKFNESQTSSTSNFKEKKRITATIDNTSKILKMFTKDLYKHPVQTAIQEYINNAKDAHLMVGKDTSTIEITAPTMANQNVIIKDFGIGLSQEDIINIFAKITASNKDHSNMFNGGFGIGSKSWFAVNDCFYVTSIFNGVKSYYEVSFTDNIYIDLLEEETTSEDNGVEVILPLANKTQIEESQRGIKRAVRYWTNPPVLHNIKMKPLPIIFDNEAYRILGLNTVTKIVVTLGETQYSVNDLSRVQDYVSELAGLSVEVRLNVGEYPLKNSQEVGPDRESFVLEMEDYIVQKLEALKEYLPFIFRDLIKDETDFQRIFDIVKTPCLPIKEYDFKYEGYPLLLNKYDTEAIPSLLNEAIPSLQDYYKASMGVKKDRCLKLSKDNCIVITGKNKEYKKSNNRAGIVKILKKSNIRYVYFVETLAKKDKDFLGEYVTIKSIKDIPFELPKKEKKKGFDIFICKRGVLDQYGRYKEQRPSKKIWIDKNSDAKDFLIYEDIDDKKTLLDKMNILKMPYILVKKRYLACLLECNFKAIDIDDVNNKYRLMQEQAQIKKEKDREVLMAVAQTEKIQDRTKWYELLYFLEEETACKLHIYEYQERIGCLFSNNDILKEFSELEFEELFKVKNLYSKFSTVIPWTEENFPQEKSHLVVLKNIKDRYPFFWNGLLSDDETFEEIKKELKILISNFELED